MMTSSSATSSTEEDAAPFPILAMIKGYSGDASYTFNSRAGRRVGHVCCDIPPDAGRVYKSTKTDAIKRLAIAASIVPTI